MALAAKNETAAPQPPPGIEEYVANIGVNNAPSAADRLLSEGPRLDENALALAAANDPNAARDEGMNAPWVTGLFGAANGATFGGADEIAGFGGGLASLVTGNGYMPGYEQSRDRVRTAMEVGAEDNPMTALGSEVAGAALSPVSLLAGAKMANSGSTLGRIGTGAAAGAGTGATYGFLDSEGGAGERGQGAVTGGILGGALGAGLPAISAGWQAGPGRWLAQAAENKKFANAAPDVDTLKGLAKEAFSIADEAAPFSREAFADWAEGLANKARSAGLRDRVTPAARGLLDEILDEADLSKSPGITYNTLDELRAVAGNVAGKVNDKGEQGLGMLMRDAIDEFVENNPDASKAAKLGRKLWQQMRNSELVQDAMEKAQLAGSGFENGLRNEFRSILKADVSKNRLPKGLKAAMKEVVDGTTGGNFLRKVARMAAPGTGSHTNMLGFGLSTGAGATLGNMIAPGAGGLVGGVLPAILGTAASKGATNSTLNAANKAGAVAAFGRVPNTVPMFDPTRPVGLLERLIAPGAITIQ